MNEEQKLLLDVSANILGNMLSTTEWSVVEEPVLHHIYIKSAIAYAKALIEEVKKA